MNASSSEDNELKGFIATLKKRRRDIPFPAAIEAMTRFKVLPIDLHDPKDVALIAKITTALKTATAKAFKSGIFTNRPNEVGNHIEPFVRDALNGVGLKAGIPKTVKGKHKAAGYPDIEISEGGGRTTYLECKTFNAKSEDSSFRAFYMQPSEDSKVTVNARHLLVGFEIKKEKRAGKMAYVPVKWKLYSLETLKVQIKNEFNASSKEIYSKSRLLG